MIEQDWYTGKQSLTRSTAHRIMNMPKLERAEARRALLHKGG